MRKTMPVPSTHWLLGAALSTLLLSVSTSQIARPTFVLNYEDFRASGDGDVTTAGSIVEGSNELSVADLTTWRVGHGVRVQRAGADALVHTADSGWGPPSGAPGGAAVSHDSVDRIEGGASVRCTFTGTPPDSDGDGNPDPIDLCEVHLGGPVSLRFDELRFWIKSSDAVGEGDLQILLFSEDSDPGTGERLPSRYELVVPALATDTWTEVFAQIEDRDGNAHERGPVRFVTLRCVSTSLCDGLDVHMDDFWLVRDLIATVEDMAMGTRFTLSRTARRTVSDEVVYHDDTQAVGSWLREADRPGGANLLAPAGVYYFANSRPIYSDTHLTCAGAEETTFKDTGRFTNGGGDFSTRTAELDAPENIVIENCGFDRNGWNGSEFRNLVRIRGPETARNVQIRRNRFFDSSPPGMEHCSLREVPCVTRQRHYIAVINVDGVWIENNHLSGGGRIKAGRPGRNMYIRHNSIDFVNDNAITVVDIESPRGRCAPDHPEHVSCVTEHVEITDNTIINPTGNGIFFGADGNDKDDPHMRLDDITIARNRISGFFVGAGIKGILPGGGATNVLIKDNTIRSVRERQPDRVFTRGILVQRGNSVTEPATRISIERNRIIASGEYASLRNGGMVLQGPMSNLRVARNLILCDDCANIQRGIWFHVANFEDVELEGNLVVGATLTLLVQAGMTGTDIRRNYMFNSTADVAGQVLISPDPGETFQGSIERNLVLGGAGHGLMISGAGRFDLSIVKNLIAGNARDGIRIENGSDISISGNIVLANEGTGIHLLVGSRFNEIRRNIARSNRAFDLADDNADCDDNTWRENRFRSANQGCVR